MKVPDRNSLPALECPGEPNTYPWTSKFPFTLHMLLIELMAEWNMPNKCATLRELVKYAFAQMQSDLECLSPSGRVAARLEAAVALSEAAAQKKIKIEIHKLLAMATETDDPETRASLEGAAERLAKTYEIGWPPPDLTALEQIPESRLVLDRIVTLVGESKTVAFRDLSRSLNQERSELMLTLEALAEDGYIQIREEKRSGRSTLWISSPPLLS